MNRIQTQLACARIHKSYWKHKFFICHIHGCFIFWQALKGLFTKDTIPLFFTKYGVLRCKKCLRESVRYLCTCEECRQFVKDVSKDPNHGGFSKLSLAPNNHGIKVKTK